MKTSELTGSALDWAVAKCEGHEGARFLQIFKYQNKSGQGYCYSKSWAEGGPIIEREKITWDGMAARIFVPERNCSICVYGPTILIAAMRCYVASKLGDEVEIPDELVNP